MIKREKREGKFLNMRISEEFRKNVQLVKDDFIKKNLAEYGAPYYLILNELIERYKNENNII